MIPSAYVIHANINVPAPQPQLTINQPHSDEHGSVEAELVACSSHTHALYLMTTHQFNITSRKPPKEQLLLHQSNHIISIKMEEEHGWH